MQYWCALTVVATAALLVAESRGSRAGVWVAKPLASTGFVAAAIAAGAWESRYGQCILAGLVLSWFGDVFLIPRGAARAFQAGLVSFLLGHVAYVVAFFARGVGFGSAALAAVVVLVVLVVVGRWLLPHVEAGMKMPVRAYIVVISCMVVAATGTVGLHGDGRILLGAVMFYVSDLAVARQRFVVQTLWNSRWGLPLYYGGQLVLAATVG